MGRARYPELPATVGDALDLADALLLGVALELADAVGAGDEGVDWLGVDWLGVGWLGVGWLGVDWVGAVEGVPAAAAVQVFVAKVCAAAAAAVSPVSLRCSCATVCCRARRAAVWSADPVGDFEGDGELDELFPGDRVFEDPLSEGPLLEEPLFVDPLPDG